MKRIILIILLPSLLVGCEKTSYFLHGLFFPDRDHVYILEQTSFAKTSGEYIFNNDKKPIIRKQSNSLCFVLEEGREIDSSGLEHARNLINSVNLKGEVILEDDTTYILNRPSSTWNLKGKILENKEFSACLILNCDTDIESGKFVKTIIFTSERPFENKGLYWVGTDPLIPESK
jgi:hypothetical protein